MARKTVGKCTHQGDYVKAKIELRQPGSWRLAAMAHGSRYCEAKNNSDQLRYNFTAGSDTSHRFSCHLSCFVTVLLLWF